MRTDAQIKFLLSPYIIDLMKNLTSITKLFADDTSIFSVVHDVYVSTNQLNIDLGKISEWVFQ